eukprot:scaffold63135_cov55-Phaeocystis_antarctica.AAC.4
MNDRPLDLPQGVSQVLRQRHTHAMLYLRPEPPGHHSCLVLKARGVIRISGPPPHALHVHAPCTPLCTQTGALYPGGSFTLRAFHLNKVPQPTCDSNLKHQAGQRAVIFRVLAAISVAAVCTLSALAHQVPAWSLLQFALAHNMCICTAAPSHVTPRRASFLHALRARVRRRYGHQHHQPELVESQHRSATVVPDTLGRQRSQPAAAVAIAPVAVALRVALSAADTAAQPAAAVAFAAAADTQPAATAATHAAIATLATAVAAIATLGTAVVAIATLGTAVAAIATLAAAIAPARVRQSHAES